MKKLYRIENGRKLLGVCGGFAEYFNIDPTIIRVAWVLAALGTFSLFFWGYLICAFVMPNKGELPPEIRDKTIYDEEK